MAEIILAAIKELRYCVSAIKVLYNPLAKVLFSSELVTMIGHKKSFQAPWKENIACEAKAGPHKGRITLR